MKKLYFILLALILLVPLNVNAEDIDEDNMEIVAESVKYYKVYHDLLNSDDDYYVEITEEEYNEVNPYITPRDNTVETNYKKLASAIAQNGNYYRYRGLLEWKRMPSNRSYDIIGVGYPSGVRYAGNYSFKQTYCISSNNCTTSTSNIPNFGNNGVGTIFALPTGYYIGMRQDLQFDVAKNFNGTVYNQYAVADYSHATSSVTAGQAILYTVDMAGINLDASIIGYYDAIGTAMSSWSGTW